jgi:hypothetical protein
MTETAVRTARRGHAALRINVHAVDGQAQSPVGNQRIGVEQHHKAALGKAKAHVVCGGKAEVDGAAHQADIGKVLGHHACRVVAGSVVDHDDLYATCAKARVELGQAGVQHLAGVERDNDDAGIDGGVGIHGQASGSVGFGQEPVRSVRTQALSRRALARMGRIMRSFQAR